MKPDWRGFATTLCGALKHDFKESMRRCVDEKDGGDAASFNSGNLMAFYHLYTLIVEHAETSEVPLSELSMDGFTEADFLSRSPKKPQPEAVVSHRGIDLVGSILRSRSRNDWYGFATTLCGVLKHDFSESIADCANAMDTDDEDFLQGQLAAYHHLYTLIVEFAETSEIPLSELSMDGFTEEDFLRRGPKKP